MRFAVLLVLLLASHANAQRALHPFEISFMSWQAASRPVGTHTLRISTSDTAYIEHVADGRDSSYRAADAPHIAALIADLTNGINQLVTYNNMSATDSFLESTFLNNTGYGNLLPGPDMRIAVVDHIQVSWGFQGQYDVRVWGAAPEPTSAALFVLGCCGAHAMAGRFPRRRLSRAS